MMSSLSTWLRWSQLMQMHLQPQINAIAEPVYKKLKTESRRRIGAVEARRRSNFFNCSGVTAAPAKPLALLGAGIYSLRGVPSCAAAPQPNQRRNGLESNRAYFGLCIREIGFGRPIFAQGSRSTTVLMHSPLHQASSPTRGGHGVCLYSQRVLLGQHSEELQPRSIVVIGANGLMNRSPTWPPLAQLRRVS
jgi:hypothetical protein